MSYPLLASAIRCALATVCLTAVAAEDLFVAPDGDDAWSGRLATANAARSDGPFATIPRAQRAVRELKAAPGRTTPITVQVRGGSYALSEPLLFTSADSGTAQAPVVYAAAPGETPVFSGGVRLRDFKTDAQGRWVLTIPEVQRGEWYFNQLWVDGARRYRPRLPKRSYHFIAAEAHPTAAATGKGYDRFRFAAGDLDPRWRNLGDVEVLAFHIWSMSRLRIAEIDAGKRVVRFTGHTASAAPWAGLKTGWRYIVENVAEALDQPGEWYLDRTSGTLTYIPMPGEDPARAEVIAPRCEQLLLIRGDAAHGQFVDHLRFENLTFAFSAWTLKPEGYSFPQAEVAIPGTVAATGLRDSVFSGCAIAHTGGYALELGNGCTRDRVASCAFYDLSGGGIKIGDGAVHDQDDEVASHNLVEDCVIAYGGRMQPAAIGVWIGQSPYNTVTHCDIHDLYYSAFSLGWTWGYGRSAAHHNTIAYNHIDKIGQGVLSDMGGIYNLGVSPGTLFDHNRIHDIASYSYGGWGIYTDEGSSGVRAENNIVYRTSSSGFHQHYGQDNVIANNIFAYGAEAQLMRSRDEDHLSFTIERNLVLYRDAPLLGGTWNGDARKFALNHNLYWNEHGAVDFAGLDLAAWRAKGVDADSLIADPLFVAPASGDFSLRPGSPAARIGFVPIDASTIGVGGARAVGALKAYLPIYATSLTNGTMAAAFPPPPPPPPSMPISDGFEDSEVGEQAIGAVTSEEPEVPAATVRVSDEAAASGKHSLKFSDAAGQRYGFNPHVYYEPRFKTGVLEGRFAVRLGQGAVFYHEWRTSGNPFHSGPSLRIEADGTLKAGGRDLLKVPIDTWVRIAITTALGAAAHGTWDLVVTLPGAAPQRFADLPCDRRFTAVEWLGFVSDATQPTAIYLDDVALAPLPR